MAGGGGGGNLWIVILVVGGILVGIASGLHHTEGLPGWLVPGLLAVGGLGVVFGSCEAMIKAVEGLGQQLQWNQFVAGTMAGLASNLPEVVMLGFVIAKEPRVAFVVVALTLHVGALAFGLYSGLLPREDGHARLPAPLVQLSTDLFAAAAGVFLVVGLLMLTLRAFDAGDHKGEGLGVGDLYAIGAVLLLIEAVAIVRLVQRFSKDDAPQPAAVTAAAAASEAAAGPAKAEAKPEAKSEAAPEAKAEGEEKAEATGEEKAEAKGEEKAEAEAKPEAEKAAKAEAQPEPEPQPSAVAVAKAAAAAEEEPMSWGAIAFFALLGIGTSVVGGHAVGEFADALVISLTAAGYSEMIGAIILSLLACSGVYLMIATAHFKGMYDVALANVSGAVNQVPFVVLPIVLILMAAFAQLGIIPYLEYGSVLAIDLETTSVVLFGFPIMLILWKSVQDDGKVNWLETTSMTGLFLLIIWMLAIHG